MKKIALLILLVVGLLFVFTFRASAASTFIVSQGGTGSTTLSGILIGNGLTGLNAAINTLTVGSGLSLTGTTLTATGGGSGVDTNWTYFQSPFSNAFISPTSTGVGIGVFASSTIGNGTQKTGLVINGGATTTGNAYFAGMVGIGTTTPLAVLSVSNSINTPSSEPLFVIASTTGTANFTLFTMDSHGQAAITTNPGVGPTVVPIAGFSLVTGQNIKAGGSFSTAQAGTPVQPSFTFSANTNTGIFNPTTNNLGFSAGGQEAGRFTAAGNFGLGTTSPYANLSIVATSTTGGNTTLFAIASTTGGTSTSTLVSVLNNGNVGIGLANPANPFVIQTSGTNEQVWDGTNFWVTPTATLVNNGNVEISPGASGARTFNIKGPNANEVTGFQTATAGMTALQIGNSSTGGEETIFGGISPLNFTAGSGTNFVGINATSTPFALLSVAGFAGGTTPLFAVSTSTALFATTTAFEIDQNGNVSINNGANVTVSGTVTAAKVSTINLTLGGTGFTSLTGSGLAINGSALTAIFSFTPQAWGNSTTSALGFNGFISQASSTLVSLAGNAAGAFVAVDPTGKLIATTSPSGSVSSVSNSDGTLTISPTTGAAVASIALAHANTWTGLQTLGTHLLAATSPEFTTSIDDANGNKLFKLFPATTAVNYLDVLNGATTFSPGIFADGSDTNVNLQVGGKGAGTFQVLDGNDPTKGVLFQTSGGSTATADTLIFSQTGSRSIIFPDASGTLCLTTTCAGSAYPFFPSTDGGINTSATTTPLEGAAIGLGLDVPVTSWYGIGGNLLAYASSTNQDTIFGLSAGGQNATTSATVGDNTAVGYQALIKNTSATGNTAIGSKTLSNTSTGGLNTAVGYQAGINITSGNSNTAIGNSALSLIQSTNDNTAVGLSSLSVATGAGNTAIGYQTGNQSITGNANIIIGMAINVPSLTTNGQLNIGNVLYGNNMHNSTTASFAPQANALIGIGSTSPFANFSIHANNNDTNTILFAIGSSTATATSTLFTVSNTGVAQLSKLATAAGTILAVDPSGNIIATTTPINTGGSSEGVQWATAAVLGGTPTYSNGTLGVGATLTEIGTGALSVDGNAPASGDRVLVKNQASGFQNGIYVVTATGSGIASYILTRATDYNSNTEITPGLTTYVVSGTANTDTTWAVSFTVPLTMGTTNLNYTEVSGGGAAVTSVSNSDSTITFSPTTGAVAGSLNINHSNIWTALQVFNASAGIGSSTPFSALSVGTGAASSSITVAEYKYGKSGNVATSTAQNIDCNASTQIAEPIGTSATTLTLINMTPGKKCIVVVQNPNATAGAITWAVQSNAILKWAGGTIPTQTLTANTMDIWSFLATAGSSTMQINGAQSANF